MPPILIDERHLKPHPEDAAAAYLMTPPPAAEKLVFRAAPMLDERASGWIDRLEQVRPDLAVTKLASKKSWAIHRITGRHGHLDIEQFAGTARTNVIEWPTPSDRDLVEALRRVGLVRPS